jgi:hypothetical protein
MIEFMYSVENAPLVKPSTMQTMKAHSIIESKMEEPDFI